MDQLLFLLKIARFQFFNLDFFLFWKGPIEKKAEFDLSSVFQEKR